MVQLSRLGQISLHARDADRAEAFYRDLLRLTHVFRFGDLVFFDCGGTRLYIQATSTERWRPSSILYFLVDDIRAARDELVSRGVRFKDEPRVIYTDEVTGSEEWMTFFEDSEGNTLALMSRVAATGT